MTRTMIFWFVLACASFAVAPVGAQTPLGTHRPETLAALGDAEDAGTPPDDTPVDTRGRLLHAPPTSWSADATQALTAHVERDWQLADLHVDLGLEAPPDSVRFEAFQAACARHPHASWDAATGRCRLALQRTETHADFMAVVSAEMVQPPAVDYFIASTDHDGAARLHFASPDAPWRVAVVGESDAVELGRKLERHHGHRSRFELRGDVSLFGPSPSDQVDEATGARRPTDAFSDLFGGAELGYTYRTLGMLYAFRFGVGIMRGRHAEVDGVSTRAGDAPGFNWGYGEVDFEWHRNVSTALRVILGASEDGFAAGVGGLLRIGPLFATHFELGGEATMDVGYRAWMGLNWDTVPRVPMGLSVEYTTWPEIDGPAGVRLLYDATWRMTDWIEAGVTLGYATRLDALDGGLVAGMNTAVEF